MRLDQSCRLPADGPLLLHETFPAQLVLEIPPTSVDRGGATMAARQQTGLRKLVEVPANGLLGTRESPRQVAGSHATLGAHQLDDFILTFGGKHGDQYPQ